MGIGMDIARYGSNETTCPKECTMADAADFNDANPPQRAGGATPSGDCHTASECTSMRCPRHRWAIDFNGNLIGASDAPSATQRTATAR